MRLTLAPSLLRYAALSTVALLAAACSSGSSSGSSGLSVESISVTNGAPWKINRPIDITFNLDIDMSTVSLNTISILDVTGSTATGVGGSITVVTPELLAGSGGAVASL